MKCGCADNMIDFSDWTEADMWLHKMFRALFNANTSLVRQVVEMQRQLDNLEARR